jgi:hypothetical protein
VWTAYPNIINGKLKEDIMNEKTIEFINDFITTLLDMQYDLATAETKIEDIKKLAEVGYYVPDDIRAILGIEPDKKEWKNTTVATEKETKKENLVDMPEGSVPY